MAVNSSINIHIDSNTKKESTEVLNKLGLSMSTAINLFLKQVIKADGIPFEVTNSKTNTIKQDTQSNDKVQITYFVNKDELPSLTD